MEQPKIQKREKKTKIFGRIHFPADLVKSFLSQKIRKEELALFFSFVFLIVILLGSQINIFGPKIPQDQIIKESAIKQGQVIAGQPVKHTILIKRSQINLSQHLVQLPKSAKNITIKTVSTDQAKQILAQQPSKKITVKQRQNLASLITPLTPIKPKSTFAKLTSFVFASLADIVGRLTGALKDAIGEPENQDIVQTSDASFVDLSDQISEQLAEQPVEQDQKEEKQKEDKTKEEKKNDNQGEISENTPLPAEEQPEEQPIKEQPAPIEEQPTPLKDITIQEPPIENTPIENILETVSPSDQPVIELELPVEDLTPQELPVEDILETVSPSDQPVIEVPVEAEQQPPVEEQDEYVQIDYETPAPEITEQETDEGKLVTVSDPNTDPSQPQLTNILAYTNIPEIFKVGDEDKIKIKWQSNNNEDVQFSALDLNNNGKIDYVEWTVPHLSDQVFNIIFISKAFRLDENKQITEDIYDTVATQDNIWATIQNNEWVRFTFQYMVDSTRNIDIYAKPTNPDQPATIEVYPVYTDQDGNITEGPLVATFPTIDHENTYHASVANLGDNTTDVFDFKIIGSVDLDYVQDATTYYWVGSAGGNTSDLNNWATADPASCTGGGAGVPTTGDTAIFDADCDNGATVDTALSVATLTMSSGYTGTVTLSAGLTVSGTLTVAAGTLAAVGQVVGVGTVTLTGGTISSTTGIVTATSSYDVQSGTISAILGGSGIALAKTTEGTVTLSGTNTFTGGVTLSAGTLNINNSQALGTVAGTFTIAGGTIDNTSAAAITTLNYPMIWSGDFAFTGATQHLIFGTGAVTMTASRTLTINGSKTLKIGGAIGESGVGGYTLTKAGTGALTLFGANTFTGGVTLNAGKINISNSQALGTVAGTFTIAGGTTIDNPEAAAVTTLNYPMTWSGNFSFTGTGSNLDLGTGAVTMTASLSISTNGTKTLTIGGVIGDGGNAYTLTKLAASTLVLSGNNTYDGLTTVTSGTLTLSGDNSAASGGVTVAPSASTGTLNINNANALGSGTLTLGGASNSPTINNTSGSAIINAGNNAISITNNVAFTGTGSDLDLGIGAVTLGASKTITTNGTKILAIGGVIGDGGGGYKLTKAGGGVLTLSGTNTFTGGVAHNAGTLNINNSNALGTVAGTFTIAGGTIIDNTSAGAITTLNYPITLNGSFAFTGTQNLNFGAGATVMNAASRTVTVNGGILTLGGIISGNTYTLTKAGTGTLTLSGTNTFTGGTTLNAGTLNINNSQALGTVAGTFTIAGGTIDNTSVAAITTLDYPMTWSGDFAFTGTQNLNLGTGAVTISANRIVTVNGGNLTVGGIVSGAFTLTKAGTGTLTLTGTNTYTGLTTISAGVLNIQNIQGTGTTAGGVSVTSGASLQLQGGIAVGAEALTLNGTGVSTDGALRNISGNNSWSGAVTLNSATRVNSDANTLTLTGGITATNQDITIGGAGDTTVSTTGVTTGSGTLTKDGAGTLALSGVNTYTGTTTISAGILKLGSVGALSSSSGATSVTSGAALDLNGTTLTTAPALTLNGTGVSSGGALMNSGAAATYSGLLTLGSASSIIGGTGTIDISNVGTITGATFGLTLGGAAGGTLTSILGTTSGALTKQDAGTWTLSGTNTFTGGTTLNAGTLNINNSNALGTVAGTFTIAGGTIDNTSGSAITTLDYPMTWSGNFAFTGASNLNLGAGAVTLVGNRIPTVNGSTLTIGGAIGDGGGGLGVYKQGGGTLILNGNNTHTGPTELLAGTLTLAGDNTSASGGVILSAGTLNINSATALGTGTFTISGGTIDNSTVSAITNTQNNAQSWDGDFAFTGTSSLDLGTGAVTMSASRIITANANTLTIGGTINNSSYNLTKLGAGTLALNGTTTLTNLTISTGILATTSATFNIAGNWVNSVGVGGFTAGTGTVIFNGTNQSLTGSTTFYSFSKTDPTNDSTDVILTFDNTATQTIGGLLTLSGIDDSDRVNLVSNSPGTRWELTANGTFSINYADVTDSDASLGTAVAQTNTNDGGNNLNWAFDTTPPTVTNATSDKTNGSYTTGEVIDIDITFSEAVTSTGDVTVTLETGDTDRTCTFTVSASTTGTCNYTVQAGDTSSDLTVSSITGTVKDAALNSLVTPATPTTNLAANKALVIDNTAPTVSISLAADSSTQITATATAADSGAGLHSTPYWFAETTGNSGASSSSDWQASATFTDTELTPNTAYTYKVKAKDSLGNTSDYSSTSSKYTLANIPTAFTLTSDSNVQATATWTANSNSSGTEYYIENTTNSTNSGWITALFWTSSGLSCGTSYSFKVKARNGNSTETDFSSSVSVSTSGCGGGGLSPGAYSAPVPPFSVFINNNDSNTETQEVILLLRAGSDATRMAISNNPEFTNAVQESYQSTKQWTLLDGDGNKTVYVKFFTTWGQPSEVFSDSIYLGKKAIVEQIVEIPVKTVEGITKLPGQVVAGIKKIAEEIAGILNPKTVPKIEFPPIAEVVKKEAPSALKKQWEVMPIGPMTSFVLGPLPREVSALAKKLPQLGQTLKDIGVSRATDTSKLIGTNLILPGLAEVTILSSVGPQTGAIPKGVLVGNLTNSAKMRIPTEIVFARAGGGLIDKNVSLSLNDQGTPQQRISIISNKPLQLIVKPDKPARAIMGYLLFKQKNSTALNKTIQELATAALLQINIKEEPVKTQERLVVQEFNYLDLDKDGIWTADIIAPAVDGEYEVVTVTDYQDQRLKPTQMSLIVVVDPEGYIYYQKPEGQIRVSGAKVTLYWLNPETKLYEPWSAGKYQQTNPQTTDVTGRYSFLVPEGNYYLKAEANGYKTFYSEEFEVKNGIGVHQNIELKKSDWLIRLLDWRIIVILLMFIPLAYNFYRDRMRDKKFAAVKKQ